MPILVMRTGVVQRRLRVNMAPPPSKLAISGPCPFLGLGTANGGEAASEHVAVWRGRRIRKGTQNSHGRFLGSFGKVGKWRKPVVKRTDDRVRSRDGQRRAPSLLERGDAMLPTGPECCGSSIPSPGKSGVNSGGKHSVARAPQIAPFNVTG